MEPGYEVHLTATDWRLVLRALGVYELSAESVLTVNEMTELRSVSAQIQAQLPDGIGVY